MDMYIDAIAEIWNTVRVLPASLVHESTEVTNPVYRMYKAIWFHVSSNSSLIFKQRHTEKGRDIALHLTMKV